MIHAMRFFGSGGLTPNAPARWRPRSGVNERTGVGSLQDRQVIEGRTHARGTSSIPYRPYPWPYRRVVRPGPSAAGDLGGGGPARGAAADAGGPGGGGHRVLGEGSLRPRRGG